MTDICITRIPVAESLPWSVITRAFLMQEDYVYNWDEAMAVADRLGVHYRDVIRWFWPCAGVTSNGYAEGLEFVSPSGETAFFTE